MIPDSVVFLVGDIVLSMSAPAVILFTILYGLRSRWQKTLAGKAIFYTSLSFSLVLLLFLATVWFGSEWPGRGGVRLVLYGFVTYTMWRQLFTLIRYQRKDKEDDD